MKRLVVLAVVLAAPVAHAAEAPAEMAPVEAMPAETLPAEATPAEAMPPEMQPEETPPANAAAEPGRRGDVYARAALVATWMHHLQKMEVEGLSLNADDDAFGGVGTGFALAAGHAVAHDLYLFAELRYDTALSPSATNSNALTSYDGLSLSYLTVGPGAAWYFGDWWLSGMVGFVSTQVSTDQNPDTDSLTGLGARVGFGYEWALADGIGLGLGADAFWGSVSNTIQPPAGAAQEFSGTPLAFGLTVSALYH